MLHGSSVWQRDVPGGCSLPREEPFWLEGFPVEGCSRTDRLLCSSSDSLQGSNSSHVPSWLENWTIIYRFIKHFSALGHDLPLPSPWNICSRAAILQAKRLAEQQYLRRVGVHARGGWGKGRVEKRWPGATGGASRFRQRGPWPWLQSGHFLIPAIHWITYRKSAHNSGPQISHIQSEKVIAKFIVSSEMPWW